MLQKTGVMLLIANMLWQPVVTCFANEVDSGIGEENTTEVAVASLASDAVATADINERLVVNLEAELGEGSTSETPGNALSGESQMVKVVSSYSHANNPEENAEVYLKIGKLPEGVTIAGFTTEGEKLVVWKDASSQEHYITLRLVEEDEGYYVAFEQPAGATIEFYIQFNSENGIMEENETVCVEVDQDKITGVEGTGNDVFGDPVTLTWTANNEWNPVKKLVNKAESNQILVTDDNQLSGELTYTIEAESQNREKYGEIWTDYLKVTDVLTLPDGISFPEGTKVSDSGDSIVDKEGNKIFYFSETQPVTITKFVLQDEHTVVYELEVPNTYKDENGVPTQEQDNLSLEMKLNASALLLESGYKDRTVQEKIINKVQMIPIPYKGNEGTETEDSVTTTPTPTPEEFIVEKEANKDHVKAGEEITYTLSITNTGDTNIKVKDEDGNYYTVTDTLPKYLSLTDAQIEKLPTGVTYDQSTNTISWIPDTKDLESGKTYEISFTVTVKSATDEAMQNLKNGSTIRNVAQYKDSYSNEAKVTYDKAEIKVTKEGKDESGDGEASNGEEIQYTVTVKNDTDFDAVIEETVTDTLPTGLEFDAAIDKDNNRITESGTYVVYSSKYADGREVVFSKKGQKLSWNIGTLKAHEEIKLIYVCTLNTDKLASGTVIRNTVTTSDSSDEEKTPVDYPIELEKTVAQDTNEVYPDGTIFDYTIFVKNDEENPSQKDDLKIRDEMPAGMLPYGYDLIQYNEKDSSEEEVSWEDFSDGKLDVWNYKYKTEIDGRWAEVSRKWDGSIVLTWKIGSLEAGEEIEIHYKAQISVSEDEIGKIEFTNTVYVGAISKSVTVYGGEPVGDIYIEKSFDGNTLWYGCELTEEQKNITFTLTGEDKDGNAISQTVKLSEFNNAKGNGRWHHVFQNLSPGTYTITEENASIPGKVLTTSYKVDGNSVANCITDSTEKSGVEVTVKDGKTTEVQINNEYGTGSSVDLQKSVWAIKQATTKGNIYYSYEEWSNWFDKEGFPIEDADVTNYVIYNMTVINTGSNDIHLEVLEDELPEQLEYVGISASCYYFDKNNFTEQTNSDAWSGINYYGGQNLVHGVTITSESEENKVTFSFEKDAGGYDLAGGKAITFLMLCKIDKNVKEGDLITNTAKLLVDESVEYRDYEEVCTKGTPYDLIQNNGSSKDEGVQDGIRTISSSVTIIPENLPVPGIEKEAVSYIVPGKTEEIPLEENSNIQPDSMVHWEITLYNDGTMDFKNYYVEDSVTKGFHLITEEEAKEKGIEAPYELEIFDYSGNLLKTIDVSEEVWKTIDNGSEENAYSFDFRDDKYAIPPGGYAKLQLYTNNTVINYQVYKNTATVLPNEAFNANRTKHGELKKNESGEYIGLFDSAEVNALGDYASISWKTVTEKGNEENTTRGTAKKNYISVGLDDDGNNNMVTYTDNIKNISGKTFKQFVVIDLMPTRNDTGVINQEDRRGSEFSISYAGGLKVYVLDGDGLQSVVSDEEYEIEFSSKMSYTQEDFRGDSTDWHKVWQQGDCSFRIKMSEDFELAPDETLILQYDGKIESGASPGDIAWNSFGYQYQSSGCTTLLKAEPPKVGVMIPKVPVVKKEVVDSNGNVLDYDESKIFTFELYQKGETSDTKLCEFTICQGGYTELSNLKDKDGNRITLEDGVEYTIKEQVPEGYNLLGIGQEGASLSTYGETYTFTYYAEKDISILARNESIFRAEIPKTGGIGTIVYTVVGALLMVAASLLYGYRWKRKKIGERR
ncbi:MAG: isopeptide-forming domain-containing fimbrial protein [Roseburia sp.]